VNAALSLNSATGVLDPGALTRMIDSALGDRLASAASGLLPIGGSAARDAYCATHHG
jgi:hypothetical protein